MPHARLTIGLKGSVGVALASTSRPRARAADADVTSFRPAPPPAARCGINAKVLLKQISSDHIDVSKDSRARVVPRMYVPSVSRCVSNRPATAAAAAVCQAPPQGREESGAWSTLPPRRYEVDPSTGWQAVDKYQVQYRRWPRINAVDWSSPDRRETARFSRLPAV